MWCTCNVLLITGSSPLYKSPCWVSRRYDWYSCTLLLVSPQLSGQKNTLPLPLSPTCIPTKATGYFHSTLPCSWMSFPWLSLHVRVSGQVAKLCDFGLARRDGTPACTVPPERERTLALRWTAPEVLGEHVFTKHADVWWVRGEDWSNSLSMLHLEYSSEMRGNYQYK